MCSTPGLLLISSGCLVMWLSTWERNCHDTFCIRRVCKSDFFITVLTGVAVLQGMFINDKQVLLTAAEKAGVEGAQQLLDDEDELKPEVSL